MKKLKEKNLPKALEAINRANMQSEDLVKQSLNTKLILDAPKVSEQELIDIQKFANSGLVAPLSNKDETISRRSGATALLL